MNTQCFTYLFYLLAFGLFLSLTSCNKDDDSGNSLQIPVITSPDNDDDLKNCLTLRWTRIADVLSYTTQVASDTFFTNILHEDVVDAADNFITYAIAPPNDTLVYSRMKANNGTTEGDWSAIIRSNMNFDFLINCSLPVPGIPNLKEPRKDAVVSASSQELVWESVTFASKYHLQVTEINITQGQSFFDKDNLTANSQQIAGFKSGRIYRWRVRSFGNDCWSDWSKYWEFSLP